MNEYVVRINLKLEGDSRQELIDFCLKNTNYQCLSIGWSHIYKTHPEVKTFDEFENIVRNSVKRMNPVIRIFREADVGDLFWTRDLSGSYWICRVNSKAIPYDGRTINGNKQDVGAILPVDAYEFGLEVPGQIKASFNRPRGGTAERIYDDIIFEFSKQAFNQKSQTETYVVNKHLGGNFLNNLPDFELEELIISYIQVKYDFYLFSNSIASKSTTVNVECEFISRNLEKADHAVVQVKGPKSGKLDAQDFTPFFQKGYTVFLYGPEIVNSEKYDNCIVVSKEDILSFFHEYKNNLPESITKWENILG